MKRLVAVANIVAVLLLMASPAKSDDSLQSTKQSGILRVGVANEAPYSYVGSDGAMTGVDFEVANAVATKLGIANLDGVPMKFGSLIPALKARRIDAIAVGFYIRPQRCEQVVFTAPTLGITDGILVPVGNPKGIHSFTDMVKQGLTLGGVVGGAGPKNAAAVGLPQSKIALFPDWQSAKAALKAGRVDGVVLSSISAAFEMQIAKDSAIEQAKPFDVTDSDGKKKINYTAYAFHPDDKTLYEAFNSELGRFLGTPEHLAILAKYGLGRSDIPAGIMTEQLCKE
jgi:polar amino acid transport system substrate-binding protein